MQYPSQHPKQAGVTSPAYRINVLSNILTTALTIVFLHQRFGLIYISIYILANSLSNDLSSDIPWPPDTPSTTGPSGHCLAFGALTVCAVSSFIIAQALPIALLHLLSLKTDLRPLSSRVRKPISLSTYFSSRSVS